MPYRYSKTAAFFSTVFFAVGCSGFFPDRDAIKMFPPPDSVYFDQDSRRVCVSPDPVLWREWVADFSERSFSPSVVTYVPGISVYGAGYSMNFHEKRVILDFSGAQFVCDRLPEDTELLKSLEKSSPETNLTLHSRH